jgi:hypothetical protein
VSGHTPGPWVIEGDVAQLPCDVGVSVVNRNHDGDGWDVALVGSSVANARLIAAAPYLLAACKEFARDVYTTATRVNCGGVMLERLARLDAAIAKAEGR